LGAGLSGVCSMEFREVGGFRERFEAMADRRWAADGGMRRLTGVGCGGLGNKRIDGIYIDCRHILASRGHR
jgi:hypothetical protein